MKQLSMKQSKTKTRQLKARYSLTTKKLQILLYAIEYVNTSRVLTWMKIFFLNSCCYDYFVFQALFPKKLSPSSVFPAEHKNDSD